MVIDSAQPLRIQEIVTSRSVSNGTRQSRTMSMRRTDGIETTSAKSPNNNLVAIQLWP